MRASLPSFFGEKRKDDDAPISCTSGWAMPPVRD